MSMTGSGRPLLHLFKRIASAQLARHPVDGEQETDTNCDDGVEEDEDDGCDDRQDRKEQGRQLVLPLLGRPLNSSNASVAPSASPVSLSIMASIRGPMARA